MKAKKQMERQDSKEIGEKLRENADRPRSMISPQLSCDSDAVDGPGASRPVKNEENLNESGFNPDELPDGYSFSPQKIGPTSGSDDNCPVRDAEVSDKPFLSQVLSQVLSGRGVTFSSLCRCTF